MNQSYYIETGTPFKLRATVQSSNGRRQSFAGRNKEEEEEEIRVSEKVEESCIDPWDG